MKTLKVTLKNDIKVCRSGCDVSLICEDKDYIIFQVDNKQVKFQRKELVDYKIN